MPCQCDLNLTRKLEYTILSVGQNGHLRLGLGVNLNLKGPGPDALPWQASVAVCLGCPWGPTGQVSTLRPSIHQFGFRPRGPVIHILRRPSLVRSPFLFRSLARVHLLHVTNAPGFRWGLAASRKPEQTRLIDYGFRLAPGVMIKHGASI